MSLFGISDLHISHAVPDKAMDVFGPQWYDHAGQLARKWRETVTGEDTVLVPGDISWAMRLQDALPDLLFLEDLPGTKILLRGNHDFWWSSVSRVRESLPPWVRVLQNDCIELEALTVAGTRGSPCPQESGYAQEDRKIYERELIRMEMSLSAAEKTGKRIFVMTHYPPFNEKREPSEMTELFHRFGVKDVVYGHLHGSGIRTGFTGELDGIRYRLISSDALEFRPVLLEK